MNVHIFNLIFKHSSRSKNLGLNFEDLIKDLAKLLAISPKGTILYEDDLGNLTILDNDEVDHASSHSTHYRVNVEVASKNTLSDDLTTPCSEKQRSRAISVYKW
ncbi:hypothetical protein FQA39_LY13208 [Lamprigera yunnana]|nr:hypothetical protein FQA39_LY13208 [Lamprigera yunnana]